MPRGGRKKSPGSDDRWVRVDRSIEQALVQRARTGDRKAFARLVEAYWPNVLRWLCGLTASVHEAEDVAQDAFLKAWSTLPSLLETASFRPWLYRIARNRLIDTRRAARPVPSQVSAEAAHARDSGPHAAAVGREGEALLQQACARLPEIYRSAFLLFTQERLPYAEIAHIMAITEETARWRVCKARHLLVKALGDYLDRDDP